MKLISMMKLKSNMLSRSISKLRGSYKSKSTKSTATAVACTPVTNSPGGEIKWELRPGGMLVQKREINSVDQISSSSRCSSMSSSHSGSEGLIMIRVSTVYDQFHHLSIEPTSTFGELKMMLSMVTGLEAKEQRILYRGKERDESEYLHMVGVRDNDKVLLLEDPAIKEAKLIKLYGSAQTQAIAV